MKFSVCSSSGGGGRGLLLYVLACLSRRREEPASLRFEEAGGGGRASYHRTARTRERYADTRVVTPRARRSARRAKRVRSLARGAIYLSPAGESFRKSGLTINRYVRRTSYVSRRERGNTAASRLTLSRSPAPPRPDWPGFVGGRGSFADSVSRI